MKNKVWAVVLLLSGALWAQTFRGSLTGTVVDTNNAAIAGAEVSAKNADTGLTRTATTDDQGVWVLNELPLGTYSVTISHSGFGTQTLTGINVGVASNPAVNATLKPGTVEEKVTVTADVPLVETTSNIMGGTLEAKQVEEMPISGRDFIKLLTMVPGSTADASGVSDSPGAFGQFSVNGNRGRSNNYLLDGTDMNDGYRNDSAINEAGVFGTPATLLPIDALTEVSIMNTTEAEYGRNSGAIVNIVTKSGTNAFHGSGFEFFRNNWLDARNFFNTAVDASGNHQPQDEFRNNQFGFSLGGPIFKDKTFFYLAYEGQREVIGIPTVTTVPSQAQITALGGATNPVAAAILATNPWGPLPAVGNTTAGPTGPASETLSNKSSNYLHSLIFKVDQHVGKADLLTGRYFYGESEQSFPLALVGGGGLPGYNTVTPTDVHVLSLSYTHIFTPRLLMENRFGWNSFDEDFLPQDHTLNPASLGLDTGVPSYDFGLPLMVFGDGTSTIGANASDPRGRVDRNWQYFTNVSYSTGKHNWKFGGEWRRTTVQQVFDAGFRSKLSFSSLAGFLAGTPSGGRQATEVSASSPTTLFSGTTNRHTAQNNWAFYLQDNWRVFPRLTVNYGLRWDYFGVIHERDGQFSIFDPKIPGPRLVNPLYPRDLNNFGPRLSVAWDVFGTAKTVVRAGWGVYYDAFSQDFFIGQLPFNTFNPGPAYNGIGPNQTLFSFSPATLSGGVLTPGVPVFDPATFSAADVFSVDQNIRTPYVHNYNLNVEQQLGTKAALQVGYVGSAGRKLFRYVDMNQCVNSAVYGAVAGGGQCFEDGTAGLQSPFPAFEYVNQFQSSANSNYNALQMTFRIKQWRGFTSTVNYTWSHAIDNASDGQDFIAQATQPDNSFHPDRERSNATFDTRNRFNWNWNYAFPKSQKWSLLLSGWSMDGVLTLMDGQPYNLTYQFEGDFNGSGEFFGRPDLVPGANPFAGTNGSTQLLNLAAFKIPCTVVAGACVAGTQHFGNVGRDAFVGPAFKNFDWSLVKDTRIHEKVNMQIRADFFNLFNHPNFTNPTLPNFAVDFLGITDPACAGVTTPTATGTGCGFLKPTATPDVGIGNPFLGGGGPRNIQLAVKFIF